MFTGSESILCYTHDSKVEFVLIVDDTYTLNYDFTFSIMFDRIPLFACLLEFP